MKLPNAKGEASKIFQILDQEKIFAIYTDGLKDVIFVNLRNASHGRIPDSKLLERTKFPIHSKSIRVGYHFWIIGGHAMDSFCSDLHNNNPSLGILQNLKACEVGRETTIWNTRKLVYYPGPIMNQTIVERATFITLNRSSVLALFLSDQYFSDDEETVPCLEGLVYSFESFQWTQPKSEYCLIKLENFIYQTEFVFKPFYDIKGVQYFEKSNQ